MSTIIKGSTKRGQSFINNANFIEGYGLEDVYERPSTAKKQAWEYCFNKFLDTDASLGFGIISHNTFQFSVRWYGRYEDQPALFIETANNSYIILLNK